MNKNYTVRLANDHDIDSVVNVHKNAFVGFFLTQLGSNFLRVMYRSFLQSASGIFVVLEDEGLVRGFAVGYMNNRPNDRSLAVKNMFKFAGAILPVFLKNPFFIIRKLSSQFFAGGTYPGVSVNSAILRSIAVDPALLGTGASRELLVNFEQQAGSKNANAISLTTDRLNNDRVISFYKKMQFQEICVYRQNSVRELIVFSKNI